MSDASSARPTSRLYRRTTTPRPMHRQPPQDQNHHRNRESDCPQPVAVRSTRRWPRAAGVTVHRHAGVARAVHRRAATSAVEAFWPGRGWSRSAGRPGGGEALPRAGACGAGRSGRGAARGPGCEPHRPDRGSPTSGEGVGTGGGVGAGRLDDPSRPRPGASETAHMPVFVVTVGCSWRARRIADPNQLVVHPGRVGLPPGIRRECSCAACPDQKTCIRCTPASALSTASARCCSNAAIRAITLSSSSRPTKRDDPGRDVRTVAAGRSACPSCRSILTKRECAPAQGGRGRSARNAMVQGAAAEFSKIWAVTARAGAPTLRAQIVLCLHDELLVYAPSEQTDATVEPVRTCLAATARHWQRSRPNQVRCEVFRAAPRTAVSDRLHSHIQPYQQLHQQSDLVLMLRVTDIAGLGRRVLTPNHGEQSPLRPLRVLLTHMFGPRFRSSDSTLEGISMPVINPEST